MPENDVNLSTREAELIEEYAEHSGITPEQAIRNLFLANINARLKFSRPRGVVRTFRLPKKD